MSSELQEWDYRENPMPTKAALRWLAIAMVIQAGFGLLQIAFLCESLRWTGPSSGEFGRTIYDAMSCLLSWMFIIIAEFVYSVFSIIVYLIVVYRVTLNANAVAEEGLVISPSIAVSSYFIPVVNLIIPYLSLQEVWKAGCGKRTQSGRPQVSYLISVFWGILVMRYVAFAMIFTGFGAGLDEDRIKIFLLLMLEILLVVNCFLAWYVLFKCDQKLRARLVADETYGG